MFDPDSSRPPARLQEGALLFDASPRSFPVILHWLRYLEVSLGEVTLETALSAANYFGLQQLVQTLEEIIRNKGEPESDWIKLNADGTILNAIRATLIKAINRHRLLTKMFNPTHDDYCPPLIECNPQIFSAVLSMIRETPPWRKIF